MLSAPDRGTRATYKTSGVKNNKNEVIEWNSEEKMEDMTKLEVALQT